MAKRKIHKIDNFINNVFEGDCLEIMKQLPEKSIDMVLCDLPYGTTQNKWDSVIPLGGLWQQYRRIVKDDGAIVLTSQGMFTAELMVSNSKMFRYKWIWEKSKSTNFLNAKNSLCVNMKMCVYFIESNQFIILR